MAQWFDEGFGHKAYRDRVAAREGVHSVFVREQEYQLEGLNMIMGGLFVQSVLDHEEGRRCSDPKCVACN